MNVELKKNLVHSVIPLYRYAVSSVSIVAYAELTPNTLAIIHPTVRDLVPITG